jgi:hypothetical protein
MVACSTALRQGRRGPVTDQVGKVSVIPLCDRVGLRDCVSLDMEGRRRLLTGRSAVLPSDACEDTAKGRKLFGRIIYPLVPYSARLDARDFQPVLCAHTTVSEPSTAVK